MKSLRKMRKPELSTEAKAMRSILESQDTLISQALVPDLKSLAADFAVLKATLESVVDNNNMLKREIKSFESVSDEAQDRIRTLELFLDHLDQYGRRQNIEIAGIPTNIPQNALESTIIDILRSIGVKVSSYEIVDCHRLKRYGSRRKDIVRFTNRKVALQCLRNKSLLRKEDFPHKNIFIFENLSQSYKYIFECCKYLLKQDKISSVYKVNGVVTIRKNYDIRGKPIKLYYFEDLENHFPEYC